MSGLQKLDRPGTERDSCVRRWLESVLPIRDVSAIVSVYAQEFQGLRYDPKLPGQLQSNQRAAEWMSQGPLPISDICDVVAEYTNMPTNVCKIPEHGYVGATCTMSNGQIAICNSFGVSVWNWIEDNGAMMAYGYGMKAIAALPQCALALGTLTGEVHVRRDNGDFLILRGFAGHFMGAVTALTVLADGKLVAGTSANEVRVWDVDRDACLWDWRSPHKASINAIVGVSGGGFAFASGDGKVRSCTADLQLMATMRTMEGHRDAVFALVVLADGQLASGSRDATVRVWSEGACAHVLEGHTLSVVALAALTGDRLASSSLDTTVRVWHVPSATCLFELVQARPARTLVFLPDGRLAAGSDEVVEIWDIDHGKCVYVLKAHAGQLAHLAALPGGQLLWGHTNGLFSVWV